MRVGKMIIRLFYFFLGLSEKLSLLYFFAGLGLIFLPERIIFQVKENITP